MERGIREGSIVPTALILIDGQNSEICKRTFSSLSQFFLSICSNYVANRPQNLSFVCSCYSLVILYFPFALSKELMNQPVSMPCGHSSCRACLQELFGKRTLRANTCPVCRAAVDSRNLNTNVAVRAVIARINVRCTNPGCSWVGEESEKETHRDTCPFMMINCPNGCVGSHQRDIMHQHLATCPYQQLPCVYCKTRVRRYHFDAHLENCPDGPRVCPLQCGEKLPR